MLLEDIKARLLTASKTEQDFLNEISSLYKQEKNSKEKTLVIALSDLHNSNVIDFVQIVKDMDKTSYGRNFFSVINIFETALPTLDSRIEDVLHCLVHLQQQAGRDLAISGIYLAFERYCSEERHRARDSVRFILAKSEVNLYAPFISSAILALNSNDVVEAINITESLIANSNEIIRNQAYFTLGRLIVSDSRASIIWDLINNSANNEDDNNCCASILKAAINFGEKFPSYWPQIENLLLNLFDKRCTNILHIVSNILTFQRPDLPKHIYHLMVKQLTNVSPEHKAIIDNIDNLLVTLIEREESELAIELLESILSSGVEIKLLDYFSYELINKHNELRNHIITKWLLSGEPQLCHSILSLFNSNSDKGIEVKAEMTLLDNAEKQLFVSHKAVGWLFTHPISAASFIISISEFSSDNKVKKLEGILYYPLLLSYPGELKNYFESFADNEIQKKLCERLLEKHRIFHANIEKVYEISELKGPNENLITYWRDFDNSMRDAHEKASKSSILNMLAKTQISLYGNSSIYYIHQGDGKTERQEIQMHTFSHSTEIPRLNILDPISLDHLLITCRLERMKK